MKTIMLPVLLSVGPVTIYSFGILLLLGLVFGLFAAWKKVEEYHIEESRFFDVSIEALIWALVTGRLIYILGHFGDFGFNFLRWFWLTHYVGVSVWGALIGFVVVLWLRVRESADFFKWLDLMAIGMCMGVFWGKIGVFLSGGDHLWTYLPLVEAVLVAALFGWLFWLDHEYRTIGWYRGNKTFAQTGFLWFWWLICFSVIELAAEFGKTQLWFPFGIDRVVIIGVLLIGVVGLYNRSGRSLAQDLEGVRRFAKKRP